MALTKRTYTTFPGYYTTNNSYNLPEGTLITAENVVFRSSDLIEPRHGLPGWSIKEVDGSSVLTGNNFGVPPPVLFDPSNVDAGTNTFTVVDHGFVNTTMVVFSTLETLPSPLVAGDTYYIINATADTFQVSTTSGGAAVNISTVGSGQSFLSYGRAYQNIEYWKTLDTSTFVASLKLNTDAFKFVEIKPQNYTDVTDFGRYRFIQGASGDLEVTDPGITDSPFMLPRYVQTAHGIYVTTPRGLYVSRESTFPTTTMASADIPNAVIVKADLVDGTVDNWLRNATAVKLVAVVQRDIDNNVTFEGRPSLPLEVKNQVGVNRIVRCQVKTAANETVLIYRTVSYALGGISINPDGSPNTINAEEAPTDYIQAVGTVTADSSGDATIDLIFNDDILNSGLPRLYTSSSEQGAASGNAKMPLCGDMVQFKGHTFGLDVMTQPVGKLQLLSLSQTINPATDDLDGETITLGATTFTFADQDFVTPTVPGGVGATLALGAIPVEKNPPATLNNSYGYFNTEKGYIAPGAGTIATPIKITMVSYDSASGGSGDSIVDGQATDMTLTGADLDVTIVSAKFDIKKFDVPGGGYVYLTYSDNSTRATLFRYTSVSQTSATVVRFAGTTTAIGDALATETPAGALRLNFYYIPGTNAQNLPLYLGYGQIQGSGDPAGSASYPAYYSLAPSRKRPSLIIGRLRQPDAAPVVTTGSIRHLQVNPEFYGATDRSLTQLIDDTVTNIGRWINANATTLADYFARPSEIDANTLLIESLNFGNISVSVSAGTGAKYEPQLTTTPLNLADLSDSRIKSGLVSSKLNTPELVPVYSAFAPTPVGSPAQRGSKLAATRDDLYVFKENEGIYRVSIQQGTPSFPLPILTSIVQLDTTVLPIAPEATQTLDDQVYFLSDRGFCRIVNGSVEFISGPIEQDVKTAAAKTPDLNKVRAIADRGKRLYTCHFPQTSSTGFGTTFVFNSRTGMWSTSSISFDWGVVDTTGRLTTITTDRMLDGSPVTTEQINASVLDNNRTPSWQYLRQEPFTGREKDLIYDEDFELVTDLSGDPVYILSLSTNVTDSSFDQYDEKLTGFTTAVLAGSQVTLTRTKSGAFASPSPDRDFVDFINRLHDKQLYYRTQVNGVRSNVLPETLVPVTVASVSSDATTTTIVLNIPAGYTVVPEAASDELAVGVNVTMDFTSYHAGTPSSLKQFSKFASNFQERPEPNSLPSLLNFQFAVDNQEEFTNPTVFDTTVAKRTIYQTLVPLNATRGRFLRVRITHSKPEEYFILNGNSISFRDTNSDNVSQK